MTALRALSSPLAHRRPIYCPCILATVKNANNEESVVCHEIADEMASYWKHSQPGRQILTHTAKGWNLSQTKNRFPQLGPVLLYLFWSPLQFGVIEDVGDILAGRRRVNNT